MTENEISKIVVDTCYRIHTKLWPGLLESVYKAILYYELVEQGLKIDRQKPLPLFWKDLKMDIGFRADLLIEDKAVIEIKSVDQVIPVHLNRY